MQSCNVLKCNIHVKLKINKIIRQVKVRSTNMTKTEIKIKHIVFRAIKYI